MSFLRASRTTSVFTRSFSTLLVPNRAAPQLYGPSGKIATKLFEIAKQANAVKPVRTDIEKFSSLLSESEALKNVVYNSRLSDDERVSEITGLLQKAGISNQQVLSFVQYLVEQKLFKDVKGVVNGYKQLAAHDLKEVSAVVTSAEPLQPAQLKRVEAALKSRVAPGLNLTVATEVDPSILGGLKILLDDQYLDASVTARLKAIDDAARQ